MKIMSYWCYEKASWDRVNNTYYDRYKTPIQEKELEVKIIKREEEKVIQFIGGPTGYESYYLSDLQTHDYSKFPKFYICAGTVNSWAECYVLTEDLEKLINELEGL